MRRLMWFSIGFAFAAALGMYFLHGNWYFLASGVSSAFLGVFIWLQKRFPKTRIVVVAMFGCLAGFLWMTMFDSLYLSVPRAVDEKNMVLTLTATDYSAETEYGVTVDGIGKINEKYYKMRIYLPKDAQIQPGDRLTGRFALRSTLPGCSGESQYSFSSGVFLSAKITRMHVVEPAEKLPLFGYPAFVRQYVTNLIYNSFPDDTAGFAVALLIGDADGIDYETDIAFKISGISHIIAVSGFHVTVLFALVHTILGRKRILSALIGLPILFFFAAVAGFSPSITRACLMHSLMIIGALIDKEYDPLTALGFAVLVMLTVNPCTVTNVSFQLSVMCMVGILLLSDRIKMWMLDCTVLRKCTGKTKKFVGGIATSVGMSVGATIFVTPLCAIYFKMVSLIGVLTNLLTLWVISIIFYGIIAACTVSLIWWPLGVFIGNIISWPIRFVMGISKSLAEFPLAAVYTNSTFIVIWLVFVYLLIAVNFFSKHKKLLESLCYAMIGLCIALLASWTQPLQDECRVTVLDVGQGQCILLQSEGKTYMVDCGGDMDTEAANIAANALLSQGIFRLDGIILTHLDLDHAGGAPYLLSRIPVDMIYLPAHADKNGTLVALEQSDLSRLTVDGITEILFDGVKMTLIPSKNGLSDNDESLCVLFQTENCDILITGDRSASGERELIRQIPLPEVEVFIVGHHGSRFSTSNALLQQIHPEIAIISVGEDNTYGHPAQETLDRLQEIGCIIYRTDLHGTVVYRG